MAECPPGGCWLSPVVPAPIYTQGIFDMGRLEKLKELELQLKSSLDTADTRSLAGIAKQYRETIKEIEEIEGGNGEDNEIDKLLAE